jgi:RNA polymerase sigma factor (sigma-70 family)
MMENQDPDVALMLRVRAGDREAFESLVVKHQKSVINAAFRYTGNPSVAEDLAQEVFLRVYRAAANYQPEARFTTWLFTIVRNICSNYLTREGSHDLDMETEDEWKLPASESNPESEAIREQLKRKVQKAVADLPESLRFPLILSHYHHLGYGEIAEALDLTISAVKVRIHRAKNLLLVKLMPESVTTNARGGFHK